MVHATGFSARGGPIVLSRLDEAEDSLIASFARGLRSDHAAVVVHGSFAAPRFLIAAPGTLVDRPDQSPEGTERADGRPRQSRPAPGAPRRSTLMDGAPAACAEIRSEPEPHAETHRCVTPTFRSKECTGTRRLSIAPGDRRHPRPVRGPGPPCRARPVMSWSGGSIGRSKSVAAGKDVPRSRSRTRAVVPRPGDLWNGSPSPRGAIISTRKVELMPRAAARAPAPCAGRGCLAMTHQSLPRDPAADPDPGAAPSCAAAPARQPRRRHCRRACAGGRLVPDSGPARCRADPPLGRDRGLHRLGPRVDHRAEVPWRAGTVAGHAGRGVRDPAPRTVRSARSRRATSA